MSEEEGAAFSAEPQPQVEDEWARLDKSFQELTEYYEQLESDNGTIFLSVIKSLTPQQVYEKLRAIENYALALGFKEAREMQHGRRLNILADPKLAQPTVTGSPASSRKPDNQPAKD
eukprot:g69022.t1